MLRLVDLGCYFSINTNMVKGSKKENYHLLPLERILIESDGPYTKVNNKKYTPALLKDAYEEISRFYNNPDLPRKIYYRKAATDFHSDPLRQGKYYRTLLRRCNGL